MSSRLTLVLMVAMFALLILGILVAVNVSRVAGIVLVFLSAAVGLAVRADRIARR